LSETNKTKKQYVDENKIREESIMNQNENYIENIDRGCEIDERSEQLDIKTTSLMKSISNDEKSKVLKEAIIKYFKNEIFQIPLNIYEGLEELSDLDLSGMSIKKLPEKLFGLIKSFKNINFYNNEIEEIPNDLFQYAQELKGINLKKNRIKKLPKDLFYSSKSLSEISFENNEIKEIPTDLFEKSETMYSINFNNNRIIKLPNHLFANGANLKKVV